MLLFWSTENDKSACVTELPLAEVLHASNLKMRRAICAGMTNMGKLLLVDAPRFY